MSNDFKRINKGLTFRPQTSTPSNLANGDFWYDNSLNRFLGRVNGATDSVVHAAASATLTNKTIDSSLNTISNIVNANISASAAIAYSKLSLSNSIVNADINSAAGIVYSKLSLSNSIVNADIATAAAIAYSKLNLALSIVNGDISASAAIAYSKLNLATSIVNGDISASAAIAFSKLASLTSGNILVGSAGNVATSVAMSGDVSIIASGATTIANNAVSNAKLAQMPTLTIKGNNTGGTANALDLTVSQVQSMLSLSGTNSGDVTLTAVGSSPNANGASLSTQALTLQPADGTNPGVLTAGTQTIGGAKSFSNTVSVVSSTALGSSLVYIGAAVEAIRTSANQRALRIDDTYNSSAVTDYAGILFNHRSDNASFTIGQQVGINFQNRTKGASSTITRMMHILGTAPTQGTNNAFLSDNATFTGNWFINSTDTNPSAFSGAMDWAQLATPSNPASGRNRLYFKSDNKLYRLDSTGTEVELAAAGSGVTGPGSATVDAIPRWSNTGGTSLANSGWLIDSSDVMSSTTSTSAIRIGTNTTIAASAVEGLTASITNTTASANSTRGISTDAVMNTNSANSGAVNGILSRARRIATASVSETSQLIGGVSRVTIDVGSGNTYTNTGTVVAGFQIGAIALGTGTLSAIDTYAGIFFGSDGVATGTRKHQIQLGAFSGATNNAMIVDSSSYTGDWVINITSTRPSLLSGNLTAASFIPSSSTVPTNGMYLSAANTVAFATNSTTRGNINSSGVWTIGTSGTTATHLIQAETSDSAGASIGLIASTATGAFGICRGDVNTGSVRIGGGASVNGAGATISMYGKSHATLANILRFSNETLTTGEISSAGLWTIGASGSSAAHIMNGGSFTIQGATLLDVQKSAASADVLVRSYNFDNTSGTSNSTIRSEVGGTSGGDARFAARITSGTEWMWGLDNSDSDAFKISYGSAANAALGTNDYFAMSTAGAAIIGASGSTQAHTINGANANIMGNSSGGQIYFGVRNANTAAASDAKLYVETGGGSAGDPFIHLNNSVSNWAFGMDNSDSDAYVIAASTTLGSSNKLRIGTASTAGVELLGTGTNDNATSGYVGEYVESVVSTPTNMGTSATWTNMTSISLSAGDWDVVGNHYIFNNGATTTGATTNLLAISVNSGATTTDHVIGSNVVGLFITSATSERSAVIPHYRLSLSATTTVYLKSNFSYSAGTPQYQCRLSARRVR